MVDDLMKDAESRMDGAVTAMESDLSSYRTGRASVRLLDQVTVELYGMDMAMNQVAVVSVPEPQQLAIRPYDASTIGAIERAILKSDLGLNPNNDGIVIRLNMPRLNEERRRELAKLINKRVEEAKIALRNVRRDVLRDLKEMEQEKMITEDELKRAQDRVQKLIDKVNAQIEERGDSKQKEIMEI